MNRDERLLLIDCIAFDKVRLVIALATAAGTWKDTCIDRIKCLEALEAKLKAYKGEQE